MVWFSIIFLVWFLIIIYTEGIKSQKNTNKDNLHANDARNILWIECLRAGNDSNVRDTKYYFLTPDRKLQDWDFSHSSNQPITLLPSQWLALLLRFFSNSNNDFKSFVSFLMMPKDLQLVTEDELQEKIAGISEITEDFQKQDDIISSLLEMERSRNNSFSRNEVKQFAKDKVEEEYKLQILKERESFDDLIKAQKRSNDELLEKLQSEFEKKDRQSRYEKLLEKKDSIEHQINHIAKDKKIIDEFTEEKYGVFKRAVVAGIIACVVVLVFLIIKYTWDKMEGPIEIIGIVFTASLFSASLIFEKSLNPLKLLLRYRKVVYDKLCRKYQYSNEEKADLEQTLTSVLAQIQSFSE